MIDVILALALLLVTGSLIWLERSWIVARFGRAAAPIEDQGAEADPPVPGQGYFWRLARRSGLSPEQAWPYFLGAKIGLTLLLPFVALAAFGFGGPALITAALVGFFVPDAILFWVRRERQTNIRRALSFFLDLLVSLLQAGLTLEEAFRRAAREGLPRDHPLAEEASLVVEELDLGRDRTVGFRALADRTGVRELRGLANALGLGLSSGMSVESTLRAQADLARAKRREEGLRRLNVAGAEILLPLILCGFPVFIVLVFFPLAILILRNLEALSGVLR